MDHLPMPKFGPLAGLRVVFSGIEIAGPFAGQMFAEWGAEVIWIENVAWADTIRVQPNYPQLSRRNFHALHVLCRDAFTQFYTFQRPMAHPAAAQTVDLRAQLGEQESEVELGVVSCGVAHTRLA